MSASRSSARQMRKTTTLKMINRIIEPTAGLIEIDGQDAMVDLPTNCVVRSAT